MNFLEYTGNCKHPKVNYIFTMKNGKKLKTRYFSKIPNPTFNTSLTLMFGEKKCILKSLLNSVLFPLSKKISKIEYNTTKYPYYDEVFDRYDYGNKVLNIGCKCFLNDSQKNTQLNIYLEIQTGFSNKVSKKFLDLSKEIAKANKSNNILVVSFILRELYKNETSTANLKKENLESYVIKRTYGGLVLIEIDLNACLDLIEKGKDIIINNNEKIVEAGKEWIKLLTIPLWCDRDPNDSRNYIIPLYTRKKFFYNKNIKKALDELLIFFSSYTIENINEIYSREKRIKYAKLRHKIDKYKMILKEHNIDYEENEDEDDFDEDSEQNNKNKIHNENYIEEDDDEQEEEDIQDNDIIDDNEENEDYNESYEDENSDKKNNEEKNKIKDAKENFEYESMDIDE